MFISFMPLEGECTVCLSIADFGTERLPICVQVEPADLENSLVLSLLAKASESGTDGAMYVARCKSTVIE